MPFPPRQVMPLASTFVELPLIARQSSPHVICGREYAVVEHGHHETYVPVPELNVVAPVRVDPCDLISAAR
jgi:hypothetical protein